MTCSSCGAENDPGANFCRHCGEPLPRRRTGAASDSHETPSELTLAPTETPDAGATTARGNGPGHRTETTDPTDPVRQEPTAHDVAPEAPADLPLRTCPRCGAANSPRRVLCGRCGTDLESGHLVEPRMGAVTAAGAPDGSSRPGAVGRTVLAVVTAGVLVGGGLGAMVALGAGPFSDDAAGPPPAVFDATDYPGTPSGLTSVGLEVGTSTRHEPVGDRVFDPELMFDGDPTTAWHNSGDTNPAGVGERIVVEFAEPVWLTEILVANGDQRDDARYLGNARVREARVGLDAGEGFTVTMEDVQGRQSVHLPVPQLTTGLTIEVTGAYPGETYPDLAVSELDFRGHPADADDAEVAEARSRFPRRLPTP